tara:strand:+ start:3577 stop:4065 length:489 start_codon:yes stop_codon:yes gene_type:complete
MKALWKILFILILVLSDQISKVLVSSNLVLGESKELNQFLDFTLLHNEGIAFSLLNDGGEISRWILVLIISFLLCWLFYTLFNATKRSILENLSLLFITGGGLGNLIDRISWGYVIDFIHLHYEARSFYVFNLADSFITIGATLYIIFFLFFEKKTNENSFS